ncbi:uncharacterized protein LOC116345393 [Contarinia nasturtii]|uniref:uncharacterized protein LOC116345393 n=1 Tax=Contarinia nasturtii TaxID=265458 RepID=UPI0012D48DB5|nr:uncharacterized protein LOC116345393 [Contarinia nasturtii]XP_031630564.1 uncharacterized protein LOC116345393 [Contarinia nasturtii]XP_031630565.1 uncharacterized protein LOC116345393 [Contarinia nasturtii]
MLIACKCLNITLKSTANNLPVAVSISNYASPNANTISSSSSPSVNQRDNLEDNHEEQPPYIPCSTAENLDSNQLQFFRTAKLSTASLIAPAIQHKNLISVALIENWNVHTCRHCKTITHAQANDSAKTLINPSLWTNQEKINIIKTQKFFSKSFNILLNPKSTDVEMIDATNNIKNKHENNGNNRTKQLRQYLKNIIQSETEATEDRIDLYTKQQMATLRAFREKAEQDYQDILRAIEDDMSIKGINNIGNNESSNDTTLMGNLSANSKLLSDLTPPVTPDSTPMSIGNSPNFKQQPQSFLLLNNPNQNIVTKKHAEKIKHSTPDKVSQRNSNADDDIFFDMDGLDTRDSKMPHMTQSDDEVVDDDEEYEDSYVSRNSGIKITPTARKTSSKMYVAQSLPMAVPIFNQRNEDDYEEYPDRQDNVDIAASIKALAQSVHGEAIFGDLPKPRFSTQI